MAELSGLKALVIEDEGAVALLIEDMLLDLGCEIGAAAAELGHACTLARTVMVDFALLDLNLDGSSALPVAHILRQRRIPFVFSTGYGASGIPQEFARYPLLAKPFVLRELKEKISLALSLRAVPMATPREQGPAS
jgi:CheY-like chemotaxis protein